jgi:hypothetical protein
MRLPGSQLAKISLELEELSKVVRPAVNSANAAARPNNLLMVAFLDIFPRLDLAPPQNDSKVGFLQTAMEVNQSKSNSYQFCKLAQHDSVSRIF